MLPENMRREAVGVSGSPQLGVSKKIDLAMSLFERLYDPQLFDPAPPRDDLLNAVAGGVPKRDLSIAASLDSHASNVVGLAVGDGDGRRSDIPDQPPGDGPN